MNKVIDSMLAHRSIRSYTDRTVSDEDLNSIIRAVQAAPNWVNPATRFHNCSKEYRP